MNINNAGILISISTVFLSVDSFELRSHERDENLNCNLVLRHVLPDCADEEESLISTVLIFYLISVK
jgi:hypothetical protein